MPIEPARVILEDVSALTRDRTSRLLGAQLTWERVLRTDRLTWISRGLSLTGFLIAAYLTTVYLSDVPPVCGSSGGCVTVQHSAYANIVGIPLPVLGLLGYLMLFITACLPGQRARTAGMVFTVLAITASVVLTYIELNVIHAVCIWCVASATCAFFHVIVNSARYVRGEPLLRGSARRASGGVAHATGVDRTLNYLGACPRSRFGGSVDLDG